MTTDQNTSHRDLCRQLGSIYDEGEARAVVRLLLEEGYGLSWADVLCDGLSRLSADQRQQLAVQMERLCAGEPVQYVLGFETFLGRRFKVGPAVLIPRPETEELCQWVEAPSQPPPEGEGFQSRSSAGLLPLQGEVGRGLSLLDIGTGSGCIAVSLAARFPHARVSAWDLSEEALDIARENARLAGVDVSFRRQDALSPPDDIDTWDVIVSNPPYICQCEKSAMSATVLSHEPHTALFVPDDDPLLFYRAIARYAAKSLKPDGLLYFEINPLHADSLCLMLKNFGFIDISPKSDQFGKQRFVRARKDQTS